MMSFQLPELINEFALAEDKFERSYQQELWQPHGQCTGLCIEQSGLES